MARYWKPKYPVYCIRCGWTGKRTESVMHYPCPRCHPLKKFSGGYVGLMATLNRRGEKWNTIRRRDT